MFLSYQETWKHYGNLARLSLLKDFYDYDFAILHCFYKKTTGFKTVSHQNFASLGILAHRWSQNMYHTIFNRLTEVVPCHKNAYCAHWFS